MKRANLWVCLTVILVTVPFIKGCGGTIGELGGTLPGSAQEYIRLGWEKFDLGSYSKAEEYFSKALLRSPSLTEKAEAYTGLGWCQAKRYGIKSGQSYFERGKDYFKDAKVGLAGACISNGTKSDYEKGVLLLEQVGLSSLDYNYESEHKIGISNAEAHAMLGILYYFTGNKAAGLAQIEKAKEIDDNLSSSVDTLAEQFGLNSH